MPEDSSSQSKTVTLKLHMNRAPRLTVTYKGKHDLFEKFKKRTQELGIPAETVFWIVDDGEPVRLDNALMGAAEESSTLRLYACDTDDEESSCSSCDELAVGRRPWKRGRHRARSHSRCRCRDHSRGGGDLIQQNALEVVIIPIDVITITVPVLSLILKPLAAQ